AQKPSSVEAPPFFKQALRSFSRGLVSSVPCRHISPPPRRRQIPVSDRHLILPPVRSLSHVSRRHPLNKSSSEEAQ
ncbi:UNVERIFIED_CONTAM: hypothetical protein Sradi_2519100, partial [Sesamum radiatum]